MPFKSRFLKLPMLLSAVIISLDVSAITPNRGWADSYSVNGKCYCATTFDHGIGNYMVDTPAGRKSVREVCNKIGGGPGKGNNPVYNTVQCGHEPAHDDAIVINGQRVKDEKVCPGRVDQGSGGCNRKGPTWDLSVFNGGGGGNPNPPSGGVTPPSGNTQLEFKHSGKCLDISAFSTNNGANVQQWDCTSGPNQKFKFVAKGGGFYQIIPSHSNKCVEIAGGGQNNSANAQQFSCGTEGRKLFKIVGTGNGYFKLQAKHSNKCLDVPQSSRANGANVYQWACHNGDNQRLRFR